MDEYDYTGLPEHLQAGVRAYIEHHRDVGGFLAAVFMNDLSNAVGRADEENLPRLHEIVRWVYNEAPSGCWGSRETVQKWLATGEEAE